MSLNLKFKMFFIKKSYRRLIVNRKTNNHKTYCILEFKYLYKKAPDFENQGLNFVARSGIEPPTFGL